MEHYDEATDTVIDLTVKRRDSAEVAALREQIKELQSDHAENMRRIHGLESANGKFEAALTNIEEYWNDEPEAAVDAVQAMRDVARAALASQ